MSNEHKRQLAKLIVLLYALDIVAEDDFLEDDKIHVQLQLIERAVYVSLSGYIGQTVVAPW
jgi:hypothetical protein